jgi:hypothetical protein
MYICSSVITESKLLGDKSEYIKCDLKWFYSLALQSVESRREVLTSPLGMV